MNNKELILTIIEIQGFLSRYGKTHTNWHEVLNETIDKLSQVDKLELRSLRKKAGATNGEMFRDTFPEYHVEKVFNSVIVWINHDIVTFSEKWWNAPYNG